jgi:cation diffusion facilitator CzcD-associated flavoprotein CzcO
VEVVIVGAGFGGLGAAISLERGGFRDFAVLERSPDVGGTWWSNSYPGCQCDVPSNLYSYSFARKPDWSRSYPEQPEVLDYLRDCARRFGVRDRIRLDCEMREAVWEEHEQRWRIETSRGSCVARVLVCAPGLLSEPKIPEIPGLEGFEGETFHTARWGRGRDLVGRRVAVVGTGATAVQIVPRIQPDVERLFIFQRTPPWILPLFDRKVSDRLKWLYGTVPAFQDLARAVVYCLREPLVIAMGIAPPLANVMEAISRLHLRRQVPDRALRRRLTPDYVIGCNRILLTNDWYPALMQPNVELVGEGLAEVRGKTLIGSKGTKAEVNTLVFATGFSPTDPPIAHRVRGADGRTLAEVWAGRPEAYRGTTVAGFPNLFLLYGPNTNLGHNSIVYMLESQFAYLLDAMRKMHAHRLGRVEVRPNAQHAYNRDIQRRLKGTVWNAGRCASWYLDANGDNPVMWPDFTFRFRWLTRKFQLEAYDTRPARQLAAAGAHPAS